MTGLYHVSNTVYYREYLNRSHSNERLRRIVRAVYKAFSNRFGAVGTSFEYCSKAVRAYPFEEELIVRRKVIEYLCEEQKRNGWKKK